MKIFLLQCLLFITFHIVTSLKSYAGYSVYETRPMGRDMMGILVTELSKEPQFDFWSPPHANQSCRVMVSPQYENQLFGKLSFLDFAPQLLVDDIKQVLEEENLEIERLKQLETLVKGDVTFRRYMEYIEIRQYLEQLGRDYEEVVSPLQLTLSSEGRPLLGVKLSNGSARRGVWLTCGMQAREWMSPVVCMWTITEVLANPKLLDLVDWYIIPIANPDGYVYSWEEDRFWRKSRGETSKSNCTGTDLNSNFDFHWKRKKVTDDCSNEYSGSKPFSEQEVLGLSDYLNVVSSNDYIVLYINIQNYAQSILYPWAHTTDPSSFHEKLFKAAEVMRTAILTKSNITYQIGSASDILYVATGTSEDYAHGSLKIPYVFTLEMPKSDHKGFNPPSSTIINTANSLFAGIKSLVKYIINGDKTLNLIVRDDL